MNSSIMEATFFFGSVFDLGKNIYKYFDIQVN